MSHPMRILIRRLLPAAIAVLALYGCETSGTYPIFYSQIRFEVAPLSGQQAGQFVVESMSAAGVCYTSLNTSTFTTSGIASFFFINAPPPYTATIRQVGDVPLEIIPSEAGITGSIGGHCETPGPGRSITTNLAQGTTRETCTLVATPDCSASNVPRAQPEVRFDVCAVAPGAQGCSVIDALSPQQFFNGSIGDPFGTHLIQRPAPDEDDLLTPAVIFFFDAREMVSAVFRAPPPGVLGLTLTFSQDFKESDEGSGDVIVSADL